MRRVVAIAAAFLCACLSPLDIPGTTRPQTVALFATPKILPDFDSPDSGVARVLDHYAPLTSRASTTILIFAVGNSDHILMYRGREHWADTVEWARYTDYLPVSNRILDYRRLEAIVRAFKSRAAALGVQLKVYDQIDSGLEFTANVFKRLRHPECVSWEWGSYDIQQRLIRDEAVYATAPLGIADGTSCGEFLVNQVASYLTDLGFDGILYGNQLGTRGRWFPGNGPGYSARETAAIQAFLDYSVRKLGEKELMWFDSYNNRQIERATWSFPGGGYAAFDYLIASGFCVLTSTRRYRDDLESKLSIIGGPRILATLDYVDPWYSYNSMTSFTLESASLERIAIEERDRIDGIVFFANDRNGAPVPRKIIESFAQRFFGP